MIDRRPLFDYVRTLLGRGFTDTEVHQLDCIIDQWEGRALKPSDVSISNIKRWEGCKLTAYPDPGTGGDPWTVGWGSTGPNVKRGTVWTQAYADERLRNDVERFACQVNDAIDGSLTNQAQFDAFVSFAYNVGAAAFKHSTLLKMHKAGDYNGAAAQFGKWTIAGGKRMQGLVNRRESETRIYKGLPA